MAKLISDPITADDLWKYLETSDFQLELDVFNSLASHAIRPSLGGTYSDPITGKDRQYDIRAEINRGICTLKLAIECKNLKENFPLLISRVPRLSAESYHEVILGRIGSFPEDSGGIYRANGIFRSREPVGKSATQVGKTLQDGKRAEAQIVSSDSETYEKWSQAIASANDLIASSGHSSISGNDTVNAAVICPVLVIPDATLWAADYSADGTLVEQPRQVESSSLFLEKTVRVRAIKYTLSHLLIFTKTALSAYLDKLQDSESDEWSHLFPDNRIFDKYVRSGTLN
jgi:hypothetical protein